MTLTTNSQRILYERFKQDFTNSEVEDEACFFELFAASQIVKAYDLSDEEIEKGILGSGNDGGCDAIYILHNGLLMTDDLLENIQARKESKIEIIIIQAKRETSFSEDVLMKWKVTTKNLCEIGVDDSIYRSRYNLDVLSTFAIFRDLYIKLIRSTPKLVVHFYYASFAQPDVHPNVQAQADELIGQLHELFPSSNTDVFVDFYGAEPLLAATLSVPEQRYKLPLAETPINTGAHYDYVTLVNISKYYSFITDEKAS